MYRKIDREKTGGLVEGYLLYWLVKKLRLELKLSSFYLEGSLSHSTTLLLIIMMTGLSLTQLHCLKLSFP